MNSGGFAGGLYAISEWIMRFSVVNVLWVIFNIPFLFILFNILLVEQIEGLFSLLVLLAILAPIVLFPATTAVFGSVRQWIMKNEGQSGLIKSFWNYYKENYKRSFLAGAIFSLIWVIWAVEVYYFMQTNTLLVAVFI